MTKPNIFETRVYIMSYISKAKKPVSNIDLQLEFGMAKTCLNRILTQFLKWGWVRYVRKGNYYFYEPTDLAKEVFKS